MTLADLVRAPSRDRSVRERDIAQARRRAEYLEMEVARLLEVIRLLQEALAIADARVRR